MDYEALLGRADMALLNDDSNRRIASLQLAEIERRVREQQVLHAELLTFVRASAYLSVVSDDCISDATKVILSLITSAVAKLFPSPKPKTFTMQRKVFQDTYPHINIILTENNRKRSLQFQIGTGEKQVVSLFYLLMLLSFSGRIRFVRRFVILDETLNGVHPDIKALLKTILETFSANNFQILIVEHGVETSFEGHRVFLDADVDGNLYVRDVDF